MSKLKMSQTKGMLSYTWKVRFSYILAAIIGWSQSQIKKAHLTFFRLLIQISISSKNVIAETPRRVMDHTLKPLLAVRLTCKANAQHAPEVVLQ